MGQTSLKLKTGLKINMKDQVNNSAQKNFTITSPSAKSMYMLSGFPKENKENPDFSTTYPTQRSAAQQSASLGASSSNMGGTHDVNRFEIKT